MKREEAGGREKGGVLGTKGHVPYGHEQVAFSARAAAHSEVASARCLRVNTYRWLWWRDRASALCLEHLKVGMGGGRSGGPWCVPCLSASTGTTESRHRHAKTQPRSPLYLPLGPPSTLHRPCHGAQQYRRNATTSVPSSASGCAHRSGQT